MHYTKAILTLFFFALTVSSYSKDNECKNPNHQKSLDLYLEGFNHYQQKNYREAIPKFKESIALDPNCNGVYQQYRELIYCYLALGEDSNALSSLDRAIALPAPNSIKTEFYMIKGNTLYKQKKYINCIKNCTEAIRYDKTNIKAHFLRGLSKTILEDYKSAFNDFSHIISEYESTFYVNDDLSDMEKLMMEAYRIDFQDVIGATYLYSGLILFRFDEVSDACKYWSRAGELGNSEAYSYISKYCNKTTITPCKRIE